ncbi:hypothetical protein BH23PLA1_BH23PLA1_22740 [soil metagenome]
MSVTTTLQPPAIIYREEQWFGWWVYALILGLFVLTGVGLILGQNDAPGPAEPPARIRSLQLPLAMIVGLGIPSILFIGVLKMTTEVTPTELRIWFGLVPTYRYVVGIDAIRSVEVLRYRPWRDCGGWGIRHGRDGERVFNARGDRGVRIQLIDGSCLIVGSQCPEDLARTLDQAVRNVA